MSDKLTDEERAAMRERWCDLCEEDRARNTRMGWTVHGADEHSRSLMSAEDLVADFVESEMQRAGKLSTIEALCRSIVAVGSGSHGFSGVQKLASRVLEILDGSGT